MTVLLIKVHTSLQGQSRFLYKQMSSYLDGHVSGCLLQQPPCQMTAQHLTLHKRVCTNAWHNSRYDVLVYVYVCVYAYLSQLLTTVCVWWYDVDYQSMTVLLIKVHTILQGQSRFLYKQMSSYLDGHVSGCLLQQPPCQMTAQHLTLHKQACTNAWHNARYDVLVYVYVYVCVYAYLSQLVRCVWWYDVDY